MDFSNYTILIIDDEEGYRKYLRKIFENHLKSKVVEARNPKEAFEYLEKNTPSLIMLDMQMPVMDGYTALKLIRSNSNTSKIPVIVCTALGYEELIIKLVKLNISDFLVKSIDVNNILSKVKKALTPYEISLPDEEEQQEDKLKL